MLDSKVDPRNIVYRLLNQNKVCNGVSMLIDVDEHINIFFFNKKEFFIVIIITMFIKIKGKYL